MQDLQIFKNEEFGEIRTVAINEEPMFCLTDVCRILEIGNPSQLKTRLKQSGLITNEVRSESANGVVQNREMTFISESNLYKVIFQSRKPEAEKFSDWVTSEVLPTIRKHGAYMTEDTIQKALTSPDFLIQLATKLKDEQEKNKALEEHNQRMRPKEIFADAVAASEDSILVGELAKIIKQNGHPIGQNRFFDWLRRKGYLISRKGNDYNMPTQRSMELKLFRIKERTISNPDGSVRISRTVMVTGKGQQYFVNKFYEKENKQMEIEWWEETN